MNARFLIATLLASTSLTACIDEGDDTLGEAESNLSSSGWNAGVTFGYAGIPGGPGYGTAPAMTTMNGTQYWVYSWEEDGGITGIHDLYWQKCTGTTGSTCTPLARITDQEATGRVSLTSLNGYVYMIHNGDSNGTNVWFSRLDPSTNRWTANVQLSYSNYGGTPALAAFNGQLVMVGSHQTRVRSGYAYPLWYATMGTDQVWNYKGETVAAEESVSAPSLAVLGNTLYLAHRWGQTSEIVLQTFSTSGAWSPVQHIPAGLNGANLDGNDVQIAAVNGYLHLIHHRFNDVNTYWWTYNRGCDAFASEVAVPRFGWSTQSTVAAGPSGLFLSAIDDQGFPPYTKNYLRQAYYAAPLAPLTQPSCSGTGGIGGIGGIGIGH